MHKDLEIILYNKFNYMFDNRHLGAKKSNMCFGFECGDGWFQIIAELCGKIDAYLADKMDLKKSFKVNQVKETFGSLRFYVSVADDTIYSFIEEAEKKSEETCELCGKPGSIIKNNGWLTCLCEKCIKYNEKNKFEDTI